MKKKKKGFSSFFLSKGKKKSFSSFDSSYTHWKCYIILLLGIEDLQVVSCESCDLDGGFKISDVIDTYEPNLVCSFGVAKLR